MISAESRRSTAERLVWFGLYAGLLCSALLALQAQAGMLPSDIPFKAATPEDDSLVFRAIAAFLLAGAAAYGMAWSIRRYLPKLGKQFGKQIGRERQLERLEIMRLGARSTLVRVRWGHEELLIGENEHGVTLLGKRPLDAAVTQNGVTGQDIQTIDSDDATTTTASGEEAP